MINHEIVVIVAAGIAAFAGFVFGRIRRTSDYPPEPKKAPKVTTTEATHPYRDSAPPVGGESVPTKKRLFEYNTHDAKYVYLACPACGGKVMEMPVCDCTEVDSGPAVHFHTTCTVCALRFAMETRHVWEERLAQKKREKKDEKKAN